MRNTLYLNHTAVNLDRKFKMLGRNDRWRTLPKKLQRKRRRSPRRRRSKNAATIQFDTRPRETGAVW